MNVVEPLDPQAEAECPIVGCLGRFRIVGKNNERLHVRTRKARALLATLAVSGRPMSREALADLLWSDRGPEQARSSLRQAVFELQEFNRTSPILLVEHDTLAVRVGKVVTDLELIRRAASKCDWSALLALLSDGEPGLLVDLDGLDPEFDSWLRSERANEPARTLAIATGAAERCIEQNPRDALEIVSQIIRLDPVNEEATRLALRIDDRLGDRTALHRHFRALRERLGDEYEADPSPETTELFKRLSRVALRSGKRARNLSSSSAPPPDLHRYNWLHPAYWIIAAVIIAMSVVAWLVVRSTAESPTKGPVLVAVLPFDEQPDGEGYLAEGIWDDTRAALSRNPSLRILGRSSSLTASQRHLSPDQYRRRFGVAYLLEGSVRRRGDQLRVSVSLTRTADGLAVWEDSFASRLGDPIALQGAIANGIEGKLRARLAPDGGRRAQQIATSPEVYELYSEARQLLRTRDPKQSERAYRLLRKAVELDPNFAPAWSSLAFASSWVGPRLVVDPASKRMSVAAARRAIALAPNLAEAYAVLAKLEDGNSLKAEASFRRAVTLDPSYAEGWNWLGNLLHDKGRYREAVVAFERAVEIDPLWFPPVTNLVWSANETGDRAAIKRLFGTISRAGADRELIATALAEDQLDRGDYSASFNTLLSAGRDAEGVLSVAASPGTADVLIALDYPDQAARIYGYPAWYGPFVRGERLPPTSLDGRAVTADEFWSSIHFTPFASRALVNLGRERELIRVYREAFGNSDEFISQMKRSGALGYLSPTVAVALASTGQTREARYILMSAAQVAEQRFRDSQGARAPSAELALILAAQAERERAIRLLQRAVWLGWLPDGRRQAVDLAKEPAYRNLRGEPRFEHLRKHVLNHIARERAELGPIGDKVILGRFE